ncbi:MAG: hypothetical protein FWD84_01080 [Oscillospiraceae bacterium]|nr:hypothetical protein [Oscillospiraceae bacterium]
MTEFHENINIQTIIGLFFLVACLVIFLFGFLLWRFRFLDGKEFYFSQGLGRVLMVASVIMAFASGIMLFYVRFTLGG